MIFSLFFLNEYLKNQINDLNKPHQNGELTMTNNTIQTELTSMDAYDKLTGKLAQLSAMLIVTYGQGAETFRCLSEEVHCNYMWGLFELVEECRSLTQHLDDAHPQAAKEAQS